jgi:isopenicillin-N epimerase
MPALRQDFLIRPDVAFLNHGSFGACPRPVFETYQRWQRELESQPVDFLGRRVRDLLAEARAKLAGYVGAQPDNVVFISNATHGVNIISRSLDLQPGDEILSTDHEYGACERAWRFACNQRGARFINQPIPLPVDDMETVIDQLWAGVTERTKVIYLSHITSPTAMRMPIAEIAARARTEGILTVIDGAHAPGQLELDLEGFGVDFYTGNCHKWLCSPKGSGFLYARPERQALLKPLIVSWGWENLHPGPSTFIDVFQWLGTDDPAAFLSVPAAIDYQIEHDWPQVRRACHQLLLAARREIESLTGIPQLLPESEEWWMQMGIVTLPECDPGEVHQRLWDEFKVEVPVGRRGDQPTTRISVQAYTTAEDLERLIDGLKQILKL